MNILNSIFRQLRSIIHCEPPRYCFHNRTAAICSFIVPFMSFFWAGAVCCIRACGQWFSRQWLGWSLRFDEKKPCTSVISCDMARCWRSCIDTWSLILRRLRSPRGPRLLRKCPQPACNQPWQSYVHSLWHCSCNLFDLTRWGVSVAGLSQVQACVGGLGAIASETSQGIVGKLLIRKVHWVP